MLCVVKKRSAGREQNRRIQEYYAQNNSECCFAVFCLPLAAVAQNADYPKFEAFGGYSFFRANPEDFNLNGWNGQITGNLSEWFGLTFDIAGHYGHPEDIFGEGIDTIDIDQHTFMGGPKLTYRTGRFAPFAQFLIGGARAGREEFGISDSEWALSTVIGGGIDISLNESIAVRPAQFDYLMTRFDLGPEDERQDNFRFSAGIVFRW